LLHIASSLTDTVGRVIYQEFIRAGIVDMPPINGETPSRDIKKVPPGYGKRFGDRLYAMLLSKSRHPDTVEDTLSIVMQHITEGKMHLREGSTIREAENYITQVALNTIKTIWRREKTRFEDSFQPTDTDVEGDPQINFADPNSFRHLDKLIPKSELTRLMADLADVHERAPGWLEAKLEGLKSIEIAQEWGVGKSGVSEWERKYVPSIKRVLVQYIQDAA
jgi:DNA-directed RNA polymerase specialized sigma24 family protein